MTLNLPDGCFGLLTPTKAASAEKGYRFLPKERALFGFSIAGLFASYCMLTQPGKFRRFIAANRTWPRADDLPQNYGLPAVFPPTEFFQAVGGLEGD